ncbi:MAG: endolytic transglycosylase MltG [Deltaproteobacteria bacterium]|nr:endolytic transglycosylase MltG [Deltaproteobacteria bacterium]
MVQRYGLALWAIMILLILLTIHGYMRFLTPPAGTAREVVIMIPRGASFTLVARELYGAGIIRNARDFSLLASIKGAHRRVKAGEYRFTTPVRPLAVIDKLVDGETRKYRVTIPEGYTIREIAALLDREGLAHKGEFIKRASDAGLVASRGLEGDTFEGYLFPDTYQLTKGLPEEEIIDMMVARFKEVYTDGITSSGANLGLTRREIVILASIIEKETGNRDERRHISAVFHNRLQRRIPLQSDPTVIYGITDFDGNLTRRHLRTRTPYNTYLFYGLPPGPIANPGKGALEAAVEPVKGEYLYFVSKNDGSHYFSRNLKEHNRAVERYQKRRRRSKGSNG